MSTSTTPVTTAQAVASVQGDIKKVASDAVTAYANFAPEVKNDFHQALADLEATYGAAVSAIRNLFPKAAPSPAAAPPTKPGA
jgi:hypothetical protein